MEENQITEKQKLLDIKEKNPFRYDSSDESDDGDEVLPAENNKEQTEDKTETKNVSLGPQRLWTEPFFFKDDDYRFQGILFC